MPYEIVLLAIAVLLLIGAYGHRSRRGDRPTLAAMPAPESPPVSLRIAVTERYHLRDLQTGQITTYASLDDVPPALRARIGQARVGAAGSRRAKITVTDASGSTRTYDSIEAMPDDLRAIYERAIKESEK
jgi:hypothetical protein